MNTNWFEEQNAKGKHGEEIAENLLKNWFGFVKTENIGDKGTCVDIKAWTLKNALVTFDVKYTSNILEEDLPMNPTVVNREKNANFYFYIHEFEDHYTVIIVDSRALKEVPKEACRFVPFEKSTQHSGILNVPLDFLEVLCKGKNYYYTKRYFLKCED